MVFHIKMKKQLFIDLSYNIKVYHILDYLMQNF